jgi:outer membrane protein TolC
VYAFAQTGAFTLSATCSKTLRNLKRRPIEAQREIQTAIYELNQLRGARIDAPAQPSEARSELPEIPTVLTLLVSARARNYDIRTHVLELEQQGFKEKLALNERWPAPLNRGRNLSSSAQRDWIIGKPSLRTEDDR